MAEQSLLKRLAWFVLFWLVGIGATGAVALVIKLWLKA